MTTKEKKETKLPPITLGSHLEFRELTIVREKGRDPLLGCQEIKSFIEVDDETISVLEVVRAHPTLAGADEALRAKFGEPYDLIDLATFLAERGYIRSIDGQDVEFPKMAQRKKTYFGNVPQKAVRWLHHPAVLLMVPLLAILAILAAKMDPRVHPGYGNLFVLSSAGAVIVLTFVTLLVNTYMHELSHLFMARSHGVDSSIRFSHRAHIIVMETDVTNAWAVPSRQRSLIFLAGMGYNVVAASIAVLLAWGTLHGFVPLPHSSVKWTLFFAEINLFPLMFQFFFWMRTDVYFAILCLTGERNLLRDSREYVRYYFRRLGQRIRGAPSEGCTKCLNAVLRDEPFCLRCGESRPHVKNSVGFSWRRRHLYFSYGLLVVIGTPYMLMTAVKGFALFQLASLATAFRNIGWAYSAHGLGLRLAENVLVFGIIALQAGMIVWFMGPMLWRMITPIFVKAGAFLKRTRPERRVASRVVKTAGVVTKKVKTARKPIEQAWKGVYSVAKPRMTDARIVRNLVVAMIIIVLVLPGAHAGV